MNRNVRIAKELVKLAKSIVVSNDTTSKSLSVDELIDELTKMKQKHSGSSLVKFKNGDFVTKVSYDDYGDGKYDPNAIVIE